MFRDSAQGRGSLNDRTFDELQPQALAQKGPAAVDEIMADISRDRTHAAGKILSFASNGGNGHEVIDAARRMIFLKGRNAHDDKFSSAVLEDYRHLSPAWRNQFLALSVYNRKGSGDRDSDFVERTRAALDT